MRNVKLFCEQKNNCVYLGFLISFILVATLISSGYSKDSQAYHWWIDHVGVAGWNALSSNLLQREVFFVILTKLVYQLGIGAISVFFIHALISLPIKFYLINKYSKDRFLSLAYFSSYYFILHDCTQIRYGMAVAFVYLGLVYLADNRKLLYSVIVIISAIAFHNAIIVFILMLFFTSRKSTSWILGMIAFAIILYPLNFNILMSEVIGYIVNSLEADGTRLHRLHSYLITPSSEMHLGLFSRHGLLIYFFAFVIFKYRNEFNKYELLCFNAFMLSIFFWILLKDSMDIQVRFNDAFGFSLVFLFPYVHKRFSEYMSERSAYMVLLLFCFMYLAKFVLYDNMVSI